VGGDFAVELYQEWEEVIKAGQGQGRRPSRGKPLLALASPYFLCRFPPPHGGYMIVTEKPARASECGWSKATQFSDQAEAGF